MMEIGSNYTNYTAGGWGSAATAIQNTQGETKSQDRTKDAKSTAKYERGSSAVANVSGQKSNRSKSTQEYMEGLKSQMSLMTLRTGTGFASPSGKISHNITIHPKLLEEMQNNPDSAKKYTERLKDIERAVQSVELYYKMRGGTVVYHNDQWYIDEKGEHHHFSQCIIKDDNNEKLRGEARKNAEKLIDKTREKSSEKKKLLKEQLDEKVQEKKEQSDESLQEKKEELNISTERPSAQSMMNDLLEEKWAQSDDGSIYLGENNMGDILDAIRAETFATNFSQEEEIGNHIDYSV